MRNRKTVSRLLTYRNTLHRFQELGFTRIFSDYLAESVGVTSSQVRKDFSIFGITGNKRGGYIIANLLTNLDEILGKYEQFPVIVIGAGHLGTALMKYKRFANAGIRIVACFDIDPTKQNPHAAIPVLANTDLNEFIAINQIRIAIICVPEIIAQSVFENLVQAGIRGVLNFAPIQLKNDSRCIVDNVNMEMELENIIYFVRLQEEDEFAMAGSDRSAERDS